MAVSGMVGFPVAFRPISSVAPFTYRDGATYLSILEELKRAINAIIDWSHDAEGTHAEIIELVNTSIASLVNQFNDELARLEREFIENIILTRGETISLDPTNGTRNSSVSKVFGNVFDNLRINAFFAKNYDDEGLTAKEYDELDWSARHFDLAPLTYQNHVIENYKGIN